MKRFLIKEENGSETVVSGDVLEIDESDNLCILNFDDNQEAFFSAIFRDWSSVIDITVDSLDKADETK